MKISICNYRKNVKIVRDILKRLKLKRMNNCHDGVVILQVQTTEGKR